ncbi:ABC transporter ATP-binding protein [bacterium]|nr:ABC transporter ATP-binding protein [bacterium]
MNETVIKFTDVSFAYGSVPILKNVNFTIAEREFVYIVGPNGGGKTTLLKLILGLLYPVKGKIEVFGEDPQKVRRKIGYSPQHIQFDQRFPITVSDVVFMGRLGARIGGHFNKADRKAVAKAMEELDITDIAQYPFSSLSGGQRQRVLIARAIAGGPDMLLLDEPTANIDVHSEDKLSNIISELNKRITVLMVSHELSFVAKKINSVLCVNREVRIHPTSEITGDAVKHLFDQDMKLIRHDLNCG